MYFKVTLIDDFLYSERLWKLHETASELEHGILDNQFKSMFLGHGHSQLLQNKILFSLRWKQWFLWRHALCRPIWSRTHINLSGVELKDYTGPLMVKDYTRSGCLTSLRSAWVKDTISSKRKEKWREKEKWDRKADILNPKMLRLPYWNSEGPQPFWEKLNAYRGAWHVCVYICMWLATRKLLLLFCGLTESKVSCFWNRDILFLQVEHGT